MNLQQLGGHTIDVDRLPNDGTVLDVGCRGFAFALQARRWDLRMPRVIAIDPDPDVEAFHRLSNHLGCIQFAQVALVGDDRTEAEYASWSTGEGNALVPELGHDPWYAEVSKVRCTNITRLMDAFCVEHWDVVKLDCEMSEFQILNMWPGPIATQISVEFHDGTGQYENYDYTEMFARLAGFGYKVVQHEKSRQGEVVGHWDSLLVLG